jgi:hypothetical protein
MRLVWHIARKDLVRLRWLLLLWGVVLGGGLLFVTIQARLDAETYLPFYVAANVVISGVAPLIAFGLVMGLVHDDPVAEIDAFWMTRPISGGELLMAKAVAWLLLGLVPVAVTLPFWLIRDYGWDQVALATAQTMRTHFVIAALALPFAVISANGSRFVMNVMAGAGGLLLLALLLRLGRAPEKPIEPGLILSRATLIVWLWMGTALAMTLVQFLRRRTSISLALLATGAAAGFIVAKEWPWTFESRLGGPGENHPAVQPEFRPGSQPITLRIDGRLRRLVVVAEAPLRQGEVASRAGTTFYIQTVLFYPTGELRVSFSEARPNPSEAFRDLLPGAPVRTGPPAFYFIMNRSDDRAFSVKPTRFADDLIAATLCFSHLSVSAWPATSWLGSPPPNLVAWLKGALLAKAVVDDADSMPHAMAENHRTP